MSEKLKFKVGDIVRKINVKKNGLLEYYPLDESELLLANASNYFELVCKKENREDILTTITINGDTKRIVDIKLRQGDVLAISVIEEEGT